MIFISTRIEYNCTYHHYKQQSVEHGVPRLFALHRLQGLPLPRAVPVPRSLQHSKGRYSTAVKTAAHRGDDGDVDDEDDAGEDGEPEGGAEPGPAGAGPAARGLSAIYIV